MLRDRLVCGIADKGLQRWLLAESELTFKKGLQLAQTQETSEEGSKQIQQQHIPATPTMNKVGKTSRPAAHSDKYNSR